MSRKVKLWISGGVLVVAGIVVARGVSTLFQDSGFAVIVYALGAAVAIVGLFLIGAGLAQR